VKEKAGSPRATGEDRERAKVQKHERAKMINNKRGRRLNTHVPRAAQHDVFRLEIPVNNPHPRAVQEVQRQSDLAQVEHGLVRRQLVPVLEEVEELAAGAVLENEAHVIGVLVVPEQVPHERVPDPHHARDLQDHALLVLLLAHLSLGDLLDRVVERVVFGLGEDDLAEFAAAEDGKLREGGVGHEGGIAERQRGREGLVREKKKRKERKKETK